MGCVPVITASLLTFLGGTVDAVLGFLRNLGAERIGNLFNLEENADALAQEMRVLKEIRDDLENKIQNLERQPGMRRTHQVSGWMDRVEALHGQVRTLREESLARRSATFESCTFDSVHSGWVLGGRAVDLLRCVREVRAKRDDLDTSCLVEEAPPGPAVPVPGKAGRMVGAEETLSKIRSYLKITENVGIIGICGMGGVGKTTLLTEINNQFLNMENNDFDVVIWVTVSKDINVYRIQEDIGVRLGFCRPGDAGGGTGRPLPDKEVDRRDTLCRALHQNRFLILLDDMWEKLDLEKVGIPHPNPHSSDGKKIVFTTRSEEVCADMGAQQAKIKVGFLNGERSWKLFSVHLDRTVNLVDGNPEMQSLAKIVVRKCGGLPLALITMGRAMSNATRVGEWRQAVEKLRESPDKIRGMKDVLSLLKFSFDMLDDDITRECLLYCVLYPEDFPINIEGLVDYWIGEGFLDDDSCNPGSCLSEARDRGDCIIGKLKNACLLESATRLEDTYVKMHDVVREMAFWLTGEEFDQGTKRFVVCEDEKGLAKLVQSKTWENARRMSVLQQRGTIDLQLPSLESHCHNLSTMLIRKSSLGQKLILGLVNTQNFCESMPALRVLDLSGTDLQWLPGAIGLLAELRHLNLSRTRIRQLPKELGKLVKLRQLNLSCTVELSQIPREAMLTLTRLQALDINESAYQWEEEEEDDDDDAGHDLKLSDVGCHLSRLEELSLDIRTLACLQILVNSEKLRKSSAVRVLNLIGVAGLTWSHLSAALEKMKKLRELDIARCLDLEVCRVDCRNNQLRSLECLSLNHLEQLKEIVAKMDVSVTPIRRGGRRGLGDPAALLPPLFPSLLRLFINFCHQLKDLRWIGQLPRLELLHLWDCRGLEELLVGDGQSGGVADDADDHDPSFPKLKLMVLLDLPALRSISMRPLLLPSLQHLAVRGCPQLKRLPLGPRSCKSIERIGGEQEWWDALEWDDCDPNSQSSRIKSTLYPLFTAIHP